MKDFIALCMRDVPVIPLNQPIHDVAMQKGVTRLRILVSSRAGLPSVREGLVLLDNADGA